MDDPLVLFERNGRVCILMPAPNCGLSVEQIVAKDLPNGVTYKIVARSKLPELERLDQCKSIAEAEALLPE